MVKIDHIQSFFASAGAEACCALCIYDCAKEWCNQKQLSFGIINEQAAFTAGIDYGYIFFDFVDYKNPKNFLVTYPAKFMELLTGARWVYEHVGAEYQPKENELVFEFWAKSLLDAQKGIGHFVRPGKNTLQKSQTIAKGKCYSKRVLRLITK